MGFERRAKIWMHIELLDVRGYYSQEDDELFAAYLE